MYNQTYVNQNDREIETWKRMSSQNGSRHHLSQWIVMILYDVIITNHITIKQEHHHRHHHHELFLVFRTHQLV
jgi:hypothetical protein